MPYIFYVIGLERKQLYPFSQRRNCFRVTVMLEVFSFQPFRGSRSKQSTSYGFYLRIIEAPLLNSTVCAALHSPCLGKKDNDDCLVFCF